MGRNVTSRAAVGIWTIALSSVLLLFGCATMGPQGGTSHLAGSSGGSASSQLGPAGGFREPAATVIREFAHTASTQSDVIIDTRETDYSFDAQGRMTTRYHLIFKVLTGAGVDGWSSISTGWEPWHELRPTITARVIAPDGSVQFFDPSAEVEGSADNPSQQIFSDARTLRAPLPSVRVGSIVDEIITVRESKPGDPGGAYVYFSLQQDAPVMHDKLVVDLPESLPFHYLVRLAPQLKPVVTRSSGRVHYVFEEENVPAQTKAEKFLPRTTPHWPHVSFSTGKSWNSVAVAYNRYVEAAIDSANFSKEAAKLRGKDLQTSVENIMEWMNARIRYTGLYHGNYSIIPTDPGTVLARGFGDCKDKAVILASILRAMGWKAHLALLWADDVLDSEPELPSLGQFNHAIVYVSGDHPVWVDATEVYAKPDVLPLMDQGRHALVIAPSTAGLVQIPIRPAEENVITDTREFMLQDHGYADVKETLSYTGSVGEQARSDDDGVSQADMKKSWTQYVNNKYRFGKLVAFSNTDPRDLSTQFEEHLTITGAGRGYTSKGLSQAALPAGALADWLPSILSSGEKSPRKGAFIFSQPLVYTLHYIIHPPLGFSTEPLPNDSSTHFGTMTYTTRYSVRKDGTVDAYLSLNTGKVLLTPEEFEATRKAFVNFQNSDMDILNFDLNANTMISQGKYREAFNELRRLISLDPNRPVQHLRYAEALLGVGLQREAVEQARTAIAEDEKSADSHYTLATILEHDRAGRLHGPSFDRTGAIAEYQRAIALDSSDTQYKIGLAHLYEYNSEGLRYGPGSDVQKAISLYEQLKGTDAWSQEQSDYWDALVRGGKWEELRTAAADVPKPDDKAYYLVLCDTFQKGVGTALARGAAIYPDTSRSQVLSRAAGTLLAMRSYSAAYELLKSAVAGFPVKQNTKNLLKLLSTAKRNETVNFDLNDPKQATLQYVVAGMTATPGHYSRLKAITTPAFFELSSVPGTGVSLEEQMASIRSETVSSNLSREVLADLALPAIDFTVKGSPSVGYFVNGKTTVSGTGTTPGLGTLYLAKQGDGLKVAADGDLPATIGAQVLLFLAQGDRAAADQWLDWAVASATDKSDATDPLATSMFREFWRPGRKDAKIAAAILLSSGDDTYAREAYKILSEARPDLDGTAGDRVDQALVYASWRMRGDESKALPYAEELYVNNPTSRIALMAYARSLQMAGEFGKAQAATDEWFNKHPHDPDPMELLADNRPDMIPRARVDSIMKQRIAANSATAGDYNQMAWLSLFFPPVSQTALDYAQQAVTLAGSNNEAVANTLAAVYAVTGNVGPAYTQLVRELKLSQYLDFQPEDWYVLGEIAEQCGVPDAAVAYYEHVTDTGQTREDPLGPYVLAQRRLAALR